MKFQSPWNCSPINTGVRHPNAACWENSQLVARWRFSPCYSWLEFLLLHTQIGEVRYPLNLTTNFFCVSFDHSIGATGISDLHQEFFVLCMVLCSAIDLGYIKLSVSQTVHFTRTSCQMHKILFFFDLQAYTIIFNFQCAVFSSVASSVLRN